MDVDTETDSAGVDPEVCSSVTVAYQHASSDPAGSFVCPVSYMSSTACLLGVLLSRSSRAYCYLLFPSFFPLLLNLGRQVAAAPVLPAIYHHHSSPLFSCCWIQGEAGGKKGKEG